MYSCSSKQYLVKFSLLLIKLASGGPINSFEQVQIAEIEAEKIKENAFLKSQEIIKEAKKEAAQYSDNQEDKIKITIDQLAREITEQTKAKVKEIEDQTDEEIKKIKATSLGKIDEASQFILKGLIK